MNNNKMRLLKSIRTKWLNKHCKDEQEFEEIQDKLNEIEVQIKLEKVRGK